METVWTILGFALIVMFAVGVGAVGSVVKRAQAAD
jgi:hypothetical protein